jgi:hypothetical protein
MLTLTRPLLLIIVALLSNAFSQPNQNTCSQRVPHYNTPSALSTCEKFSPGKSYTYPTDFAVLNYRQWYECPTSGYRIVTSNDIPDHDVTVNNPNEPCEIPLYIRLPLNGTYSSTLTEPSNLGVIAIQLNGVLIFGAQEAEGYNAVQPGPSGQVQDAQYWYGHSDMQHNWHYHNPFVGNPVQPPSNQLIAYSLDGFPIYGPVSDTDLLDSCNGRFVNGKYQYHVRTIDQVNGYGPYCNGTSPAILWNYVLGCYRGSLSTTQILSNQSTQAVIPKDCVKVFY